MNSRTDACPGGSSKSSQQNGSPGHHLIGGRCNSKGRYSITV